MIHSIAFILMPILSILVIVLTFVVALTFSNWMNPVGGIIYALSALPAHIPVVGRFYAAVFIEGFRISFAVKMFSMIISASGVFIPTEIMLYIIPNALNNQDVIRGLLISTTVSTLDIGHRVHLMEVPDVERALKGVINTFPFLAESVRGQKFRIAHVQFIERAITDFLIIVFGYGMSLYFMDHLGLFSSATHISSPFRGILIALNSAQINVAQGEAGPTGDWAIGLRFFYGLSLLIFTVFFLAVATNLIGTADRDKELRDVVEAFAAGYLSRSNAAGGAADGPREYWWRRFWPRIQRSDRAPPH